MVQYLLLYIFPVYSIVKLGTLLEGYLRKFHILFGQNLPLWKMRKYLKSVPWKVLVFINLKPYHGIDNKKQESLDFLNLKVDLAIMPLLL